MLFKNFEYLKDIPYEDCLNQLLTNEDNLLGSENFKTVKIQRNHINKNGFLLNFDPVTFGHISRKINQNIQTLSKNKQMNLEDLLMETFDLIMLWGGKMGRFHYLRKKGQKLSPRENLRAWIDYYKLGCVLSLEGKYEEALRNFVKVPQLGISFGTKHLKFWGGMPVFDTRISVLMYNKNWAQSKKTFLNMKGYTRYLNDLKKLEEIWKVDTPTVENILFNFSSKYFKNSQLSFASPESKYKKNDSFKVAKLLTNTC